MRYNVYLLGLNLQYEFIICLNHKLCWFYFYYYYYTIFYFIIFYIIIIIIFYYIHDTFGTVLEHIL